VSLTLFTSPLFREHLNPPGHPERVERVEVMQAVAEELRRVGAEVHQPRRAEQVEIERVHAPEYISLVRETAGRAVALDPDTFTSSRTWEAATLAAGAAVSAVEYVLSAAEHTRACALVRPPGHHAERGRAMGFCLFNNAAIAAAHARSLGLSRVAIIDFDVHHGNGTQWTFYDDPSVLFVSSHQYPYYPGTGAAGDIGSGAGVGFTVNLPLAAGATDADYDLVYSRIALPIVRQFRPELIVVSAGYDAHADDPLAGMRLTAPYFGHLMSGIAELANECCGGRVVAVTEGGYDLRALAASLTASLHALADHASRRVVVEGPAPRGESTFEAVAPGLSRYWRL
jgi:acetoin utilization deacetylase AcuC-like enzyme